MVALSLEDLKVRAVNYGSKSRPRLTVEAELLVKLEASPDEVHSAMVEERLISFDTVPSTAVTNFRGSSTGDAPYYVALVEYRGSLYEYRVAPSYAGGMMNITYWPSVSPEALRSLHPVSFKAVGARVLSFKLSNYRFTSGLKRYEELHMEAYGEDQGPSTIAALFRESGLESKALPCSKAFQAFERSLARLGGPESSA